MANKHDFPNICGLLWDTDAGRRVGSGFVIGPRHVLTVGHNLYDPSINSASPFLSRNIVAFFAGASPGREEQIAAERIEVHAKWRADATSDRRYLSAYDIGIVVLGREPRDLQNRSFSVNEPVSPPLLGIGGYPKEASQGSGGLFRSVSVFAEEPVACPDPAYEYRLYYPPLMMPPERIEGISGGPAYLLTETGEPVRGADGRVQAIGVQSSWVRFDNTLLASAVVLYEDGILPIINAWLRL